MSSVTKASKGLSDSIMNKIKELFSDDQQQMFVQSFQAYLKYDPVKDFVVNLDEVYSWIGFARKDHAKRLVVSKFEKEADYINEKGLVFPPKGENSKGGRRVEVIMLNIDTFKNLCMLANTSKGKEVRKMYIAMERVLHQVLEEEHKQQLEENNQKVLELETQLQEKEKQLLAIQASQPVYEEVLKSGYVYVLSTDKPGTFKVGRSKNEVKKRVSQLQTAVVDEIKIEYDFPTSNENLLETIMHYILDRYRTNYNREHFTCRKEYIITVLKIAGNYLDTLKSSYQKIEKGEILEKIAEKLEEEVEAESPDRKEGEVSLSQPEQPKDFFRYLTEYATFKEGASTPLSTIRDRFSTWIGKDVKKLENGTFFQVNKEFSVEVRMICKTCLKDHKVGCCEDYDRLGRTSKQVVRNLELVG